MDNLEDVNTLPVSEQLVTCLEELDGLYAQLEQSTDVGKRAIGHMVNGIRAMLGRPMQRVSQPEDLGRVVARLEAALNRLPRIEKTQLDGAMDWEKGQEIAQRLAALSLALTNLRRDFYDHNVLGEDRLTLGVRWNVEKLKTLSLMVNRHYQTGYYE